MEAKHEDKYQIVFDCTGTSSGFETAVRLSNRVVHLKSTCGSTSFGCKEWTAFVVDEFSLIPWKSGSPSPLQSFRFSPSSPYLLDMFPRMKNRKFHILVTPSTRKCPQALCDFKDACDAIDSVDFHEMELKEALQFVQSMENPMEEWSSPFPRFDLVLTHSLTEFDSVVRPTSTSRESPLLSRSPIVVLGEQDPQCGNILQRKVMSGTLQIRSSRCGHLPNAISLLGENASLAHTIKELIISHYAGFHEFPEAIQLASSSACTKVVLTAP